MSVWIGIDPGLHGALAVVSESGAFVTVWDTPVLGGARRGRKTRRGVRHMLDDYDVRAMASAFAVACESGSVDGVVLEEVGARPQQGSTSTFLLGRGVGLWEGIIGTRGFIPVKVPPARWKMDMVLLDATKSEVVEEARGVWPMAGVFALAKHDGRAEAAFLALWGVQYGSAARSG